MRNKKNDVEGGLSEKIGLLLELNFGIQKVKIICTLSCHLLPHLQPPSPSL